MAEVDVTKEQLRDLLANGLDLKSTLGPLVTISGQVQHIHLHIASGPSRTDSLRDEVRGDIGIERSRLLIGIRARLGSIPGGQRRVTAYLRREFGMAEPEDLFGDDLERLYSWVHSLPVVAEDSPR